MCLGLHFPRSQSWDKDLAWGSLMQRWLQEAMVPCMRSGGGKWVGGEANRGLICCYNVNDCFYWREGKLEHVQWLSIQYWRRDASRAVNFQYFQSSPCAMTKKESLQEVCPWVTRLWAIKGQKPATNSVCYKGHHEICVNGKINY